MFFVSGAAALILEVLWTRQFVPVFGSSTYAITTVLCAFMAGLGLGSLLFGRVADRCRDHLLLYALMEGGIALFALLVPVAVAACRTAAPALLSWVRGPLALSLVRFGFSFVILLVPCVLMGGKLPVLARFCVSHKSLIGSRIGILYGLNTAGAAVGCFAAGFYLLETWGMAITNRLAGALVFALAATALGLRRLHEKGQPARPKKAHPRRPGPPARGICATEDQSPSVRRLLLWVAFVSGFVSLSCEVLWVRCLAFVVPNTTYSFTSILGVFLLALSAGSLLYRLLLAGRAHQLLWLARIEILLGLLIVGMFLGVSELYISRPAGLSIRAAPSSSMAYKMTAVGAAALTMFIPTVLMGMVLPLACGLFPRDVGSLGRGVGAVFAVNNVGCILGAAAPVVLLVPQLGIQFSLFAIGLLVSVTGLAALAVAAPPVMRWRRLVPAGAGVVAAFVLLAWPLSGDLIPRLFLSRQLLGGAHQEVTFYREGRTATVMIVRDRLLNYREIYINGVQEVPTSYVGHSFFKLLGTLGALNHQRPDEVLVLCLGGGITAGTVLQHPEVRRVVGVDLVAEMIEACEQFSAENNKLTDSDKFEPVVEDARNYLLRVRERFPVIMSDSTHPRSPDSWVLYTREFYELVRRRLTDDGVFLQWLPVHQLSLTEWTVVLKTFQSVFPHTSVWLVAGHDENGVHWVTTLLMGTPQRLSIDVAAWRRRLSHPAVRRDLAPWSFDRPAGVLEAFLCGEDTVRRLTEHVPINTDDLPYTQYLTPLSTDLRAEEAFPDLLESVWPFLTNTGDRPESEAMRELLDERRRAWKLYLNGHLSEAFALVPECPKMRRIQRNLRRSEAYRRELRRMYGQSQ